MFPFRHTRYASSCAVAQRLGVSHATFLFLCGQDTLLTPKPILIRGKPRWDMAQVEYWLGTLSAMRPPSFDDWAKLNARRVACYSADGWSLWNVFHVLVRRTAG